MDLKSKIRTIHDYPKAGIAFRDISTLLADADAFRVAVENLAEQVQGFKATAIVGIEARGFILGAALALKLGLGFVPVRKKGKLPGSTYSESYELEYGTDTLEVQQDAFAAGAKVVLIDDLIATGGTALAAHRLCQKAGASVCHAAFVIDLPDLGGRVALAAQGCQSSALVAFSGH